MDRDESCMDSEADTAQVEVVKEDGEMVVKTAGGDKVDQEGSPRH